jgi:DNA-binding winged helix-turn-helix (wHTH) protein
VAVGVISRDRERRILYLNPRAETLTGQRDREARGELCSQVVCHADAAGQAQCAGHCPAQDCLNGGGQQERRLWLRTVAGGRLAVVSRFAPLRDADGKVVGTVETLTLADGLAGVASDEGLTVDLSLRRVCRDGVPVRLTRTEFDLLACLARVPGRAVSHAELLQRVWGPECEGQTQYLHTFVAQLRRKLELDSRHPCYITSEPRYGYRLCQGRVAEPGIARPDERPSSGEDPLR